MSEIKKVKKSQQWPTLMTSTSLGHIPEGAGPKKELTTVGIVGLDYCGSTLMNNILSGLPSCIGAGETHWIIDSKHNSNQRGRCTECYTQDCPVFSNKLLEELKTEQITNDGSWWENIGIASGCEIVVSADKRPRHYDRFGVPDKLLFMIKDPRAHIVSWAKRKFLQPDQNMKKYNQGADNFSLTDEQFNEAFTTWLRDTRKHISWSLNTSKELAVVSLEYFVENDEEVLEDIAKWIGIEFDDKALEYWDNDLHYIGSNHSVKRLNKDRYFFKQVKRDRRWENVLTPEQSEFITSHEKVHYQLNRLKPFILGSQVLMDFD